MEQNFGNSYNPQMELNEGLYDSTPAVRVRSILSLLGFASGVGTGALGERTGLGQWTPNA